MLLFSSFWIKRYLPLIYPILYFNKLLLSTEAEACAKLAIKNKEHCVKSVQIRSFFWSVFSCIRTGYGDLLRKPPYPVRIQENTDQKKLRIWTLFTQRKYHQQNKSLNTETCETPAFTNFQLEDWPYLDTHREKAPSNNTAALTKSRNTDIWVVGTSDQFFIRGFKLKIKIQTNKVITDKILFFVIGPFCPHQSICLNIGFWYGSFVWKWCVFNLSLSTKKF